MEQGKIPRRKGAFLVSANPCEVAIFIEKCGKPCKQATCGHKTRTLILISAVSKLAFFYGSKVWHSNTKYKRTVWQCNNKFKHEEKCGTPHLYEAEIQESFVKALSLLLADKEKLLIHCRELKDELTACSTEEARLEELSQEMEVVAEMISQIVNENATRALDQEDYQKRYDMQVSRYETLQAEFEETQSAVKDKNHQSSILSGFMFAIFDSDILPVKFSNTLWMGTVDTVTVNSDNTLRYRFKDGSEISLTIPGRN